MSTRPRYYGIDSHPITQQEWIDLIGDDAARRVARDEVGEAEVSTVLLGLDHNFGDGPPLIFESMIFGGDHDGGQWRYSTLEQAETGHRRIVAALEDGREP